MPASLSALEALIVEAGGQVYALPLAAIVHAARVLPADLNRYVVEKGSITVDGISLTVASVDADSFTVSLIPTTLALTTLGHKATGALVNLEVDVIAKYVEKLVRYGGAAGASGRTQ